LVKEIYQTLNERLEKLRRRKSKVFPIIISFLSGITIDKLKSLFPEDVHIIKTLIHPKTLKAYDEIYNPQNFSLGENEKNLFRGNTDGKRLENNQKMRGSSKFENIYQSQINYNKSECNFYYKFNNL